MCLASTFMLDRSRVSRFTTRQQPRIASLTSLPSHRATVPQCRISLDDRRILRTLQDVSTLRNTHQAERMLSFIPCQRGPLGISQAMSDGKSKRHVNMHTQSIYSTPAAEDPASLASEVRSYATISARRSSTGCNPLVVARSSASTRTLHTLGTVLS